MKTASILGSIMLAAAAVRAEMPSVVPPPVSQEISSFGACLEDGFVYVYGGHTGKAHAHSRDNLSADFLRYPLGEKGAKWEMLPEDKAVQGTALVGWEGRVIRIGGMYATNEAGDDSVLFSTDSVRCYDPQAKSWTDWPSLPEKVSSHDAIVLDDVLYVIGGWKLDGPGDNGVWHAHGWSLELHHRDRGWKNLPDMPDVRRAGTLATAGEEVWWVGGMGDEEGLSSAAFAYHPKKNAWRRGPDVPTSSRIQAFGSATFSARGTIFNSGMDGVVYALDPAADSWSATTVSHQHARIFHRSVAVGDGYFWTIAGASRKGHRKDVEVLPIPAQFAVKASAGIWPAFRGGANNEVAASKLSEKWGDEQSVAWTVSLPGYGQSTPVFADGGIYVSTAVTEEVPEKKKVAQPEVAERANPRGGASGKSGGKSSRGEGDGKSDGKAGSRRGDAQSMAALLEAANGPMKTKVAITRIDGDSGEINWTMAVPSSDPEPKNKYRSCAAPSPCVDGEAVYAWFESGDLMAVGHDGKELWHRNIGKQHGLPKGNHGLGGSLVQDRDSLFVLVDHDGPSYLLCVDKKSGEDRWKVEREKRVSWSTPVVTGDAVIICSNGVVEEFDKANGEQRWVVEGLEGNTVASPLVFRDFVLAPSSEEGQTQLIRRGKDVTAAERVVWKAGENTSSFSSPVFTQGQIILVSKAGIASGLDWRTGEELWNLRLPESCWATPVVIDKNIYFFTKSGMTLVTTLTPSGLHELHQNDLTLEAGVIYGVIAVDDKWLMRSGDRLIAIASRKGKAES